MPRLPKHEHGILPRGCLYIHNGVPKSTIDRVKGEHELTFQSAATPTADGRRFSVSIERMTVETADLPESSEDAPQFTPSPVIQKLNARPCLYK